MAHLRHPTLHPFLLPTEFDPTSASSPGFAFKTSTYSHNSYRNDRQSRQGRCCTGILWYSVCDESVCQPISNSNVRQECIQTRWWVSNEHVHESATASILPRTVCSDVLSPHTDLEWMHPSSFAIVLDRNITMIHSGVIQFLSLAMNGGGAVCEFFCGDCSFFLLGDDLKEWRNVPSDCSLDCRRFEYIVVSFVYARSTMRVKESE